MNDVGLLSARLATQKSVHVGRCSLCQVLPLRSALFSTLGGSICSSLQGGDSIYDRLTAKMACSSVSKPPRVSELGYQCELFPVPRIRVSRLGLLQTLLLMCLPATSSTYMNPTPVNIPPPTNHAPCTSQTFVSVTQSQVELWGPSLCQATFIVM